MWESRTPPNFVFPSTKVEGFFLFFLNWFRGVLFKIKVQSFYGVSMAQNRYAVLFFCVFLLSVSLKAASFREKLQSFCNQVDRWGQSLVDRIVYCDCSDQCPVVDMSFIAKDCPSVFAADWGTNADPHKLPQAQAILAVAGLSSACCSFLGEANISKGNPLPQGKGGAYGANNIVASPRAVIRAPEVQNDNFYPAAATGAFAAALVQKDRLEKIYRIEDLTFEMLGPHGNKGNSVYITKDARRVFVKNRHLKNNYDSFLVSFFMSRLGEKLCPGQIVKIVPVIDNGELRIGSFEIENYIGKINQESRNYRLLSLSLDLMRISDRDRGNLGYSSSTNLAAAVDVDLGGFEEGSSVVDMNRSWITRLRDNYNVLDDEFRNALNTILAYSEADLLRILEHAEDELGKILPSEHHSILSNKHGPRGNMMVSSMKYKVMETLRQMDWVAKNFELVRILTDASKRQHSMSDLVRPDSLPSDEHGFLLHEAVVREDAEVISKLCASRGRGFNNILIYGSVKSRNRQVLEAIRRCCLDVPEWISFARNCEITMSNLR